MKLIAEIFHDELLNIWGRSVVREAVRGIFIDDSKVFMLYSGKFRGFSFPGGGIEPGEEHADTLIREIREETGGTLEGEFSPFGKVIQYSSPIEATFDVFRVTSYYYLCKISFNGGAQALEDYEREWELTPTWVEIKQAIEVNQATMSVSDKLIPRWIKRDLTVLEMLQTPS